MYLVYFSYPFIGPANRSRYTQAVHSNKELEGSHGIMMSLINQAGAAAGLVAPTLVASFVLRTQEDIDASPDKHQLTPGGLYVPIFCAVIITGVIYQHFTEIRTKNEPVGDTGADSESTKLLSPRENRTPRASVVEISETFSRASEVNRRMSVDCMGISNPVETKYEQELATKLLEDKKIWEELQELDEIED